MLALIEEDVQRLRGQGLMFTAWVLDHIDPLNNHADFLLLIKYVIETKPSGSMVEGNTALR